MNKTPFNQLIQEHLPNDDIEIKKIEYRREESVLSIRLRSNKYVAGHQLDGLKNILKTHLAFVNDFEIEVETPEDHQPINTSPSTPQANQDTGFMENWDNILMVIRRKNPAVASILKRSKIAFNHGKIHIIFDDKGLENTFYQYKTDEMIQMICDRNLGQTFELHTESLKDEVDGYEDFDRMQDETIESIVAMATNGFSEEAIRQSAQKKEESVKSVKSNAPEVLYRNKIKRQTTKIIDINQEEETYAIEG